MFLYRWYRTLTVGCLLLLFFTACGSAEPNPNLEGRILIWHTWANGDAAALDEVVATFQEIHPDVSIKQQRFADMDTMLTQFRVAADAGLGPDLLIAPGQQVRPLANAALIDPVEPFLDETIIQRYAPAALDSLRYNDQLYALPATMDTEILYYDTQLVEKPVSTLDTLLAEATQGRVVAISTNFIDAFWGVQAFGGSLFDEGRRVILDRGGFANWLAWLKDARDTPGMILDSNRDALRSRFMEHGVAYYVGYTSEMSSLVEAMGQERVGVSTLPSGPNGNAAPFLSVQAFLFNTVSSDNQRRLATEFTTFFTNAEQQSSLMRETQLIPANTRVRVNPRLDPIMASFTAQARTAVPLLNIPEMDAVLSVGGDAYARVLEGVVEPAEASIAVTTAINEVNGFAEVATPQFECAGVGTIYLGYAIAPKREAALTRVLAQMRRDCPTIIVTATPVTQEEVATRLSATLASDGRLDLLMVPHQWIPALVNQQQLRDLTSTIDAETLQRYRPVGVDAMRYQGGLYGVPTTIDLDALYYNRTLVVEPARTLEELVQQATDGVPIALETSFVRGFWGIAAFGGTLLNGENTIGFGDGSFAAWLAWLQLA
ncbi:MAG: extracellular solute-binding protein [Caldilineaceae bacterium]